MQKISLLYEDLDDLIPEFCTEIAINANPV